ncbi:hypothetical protein CFP66_41230 [Pseudonocardia sp. MH-G8]|nr:hypothetical protein CFP66_41230 [Pseudonocardia sp. MH-G8]
MRALAEPPRPPELTIEVVSHMWWWEARYPDTGFETANEIHVPVGEPVSLRLWTADVIHSFWVPRLAPNLLPDRVNEMCLLADETGTFRGQCAESCGIQHANMAFRIVAEPREQFEAWLAQQSRPARSPRPSSPPEAAASLRPPPAPAATPSSGPAPRVTWDRT